MVFNTNTMDLILDVLDGNLEFGTHVRSNIYYSICLKNLKIESTHKSIFLFSQKSYFSSSLRNMLQSNISTMVIPGKVESVDEFVAVESLAELLGIVVYCTALPWLALDYLRGTRHWT